MKKNNKKRIRIVIIVAAVALVLLVFFFWRSKQPAWKDAPVLAGQNVVVTVSADKVEDLYGYQLQLHYDEDAVAYTGELTSELDEILTIFGKPFQGYELIGATMIGEKPGVTKRNPAVCTVVFTAKRDTTLSALDFTIEDVRVVSSSLDYTENIQGWTLSTSVDTVEQ